MSRLQILILVVSLLGVQLTILFPPWVEELAQADGSLHRDPYCCFDTPIWSPPQPLHDGASLSIDMPRVVRQIALIAGAGTALFLFAGRLHRRRRQAAP